MKKSLILMAIVAILSFALGVVIQTMFQPVGAIFSDPWCKWFGETYSIALGFLYVKLPVAVFGVAQDIAWLHPEIKSNSVFGLITHFSGKKNAEPQGQG